MLDINYRELLIAYMKRVIDAEGVSYVDGGESCHPPPITEEQLSELRNIEKEICANQKDWL